MSSRIVMTASIAASEDDIRIFLAGGIPPGFVKGDVKILDIRIVPDEKDPVEKKEEGKP